MEGFKIEVEKRELSNKKSFVKSIRNLGNIPGVYYSHDSKNSIPFSVNEKILHQALKATSQIYQITVGGKKRDVIIKSIQYHPISDQIVHIDLYGVKMDQEVSVKVPIIFVGQSVGVTNGGILNQSQTELEVSCLPSSIPQNIEIDISHLDIGDTIRLADISIDNATLVGDSDLLVASIIMPAKVEEESTVEDSDDTELDSDTSEDTAQDNQTEEADNNGDSE